MWLKTHKPVADNAVVNRDSSQESNNKCIDSYCNSHNNTCADSSICDEGGLYIICRNVQMAFHSCSEWLM